jgi:hypothetical protein
MPQVLASALPLLDEAGAVVRVAHVRHADDHYATPAWVTRAILPHLPAFDLVLDPCCADGAILDVFREQRPRVYTNGYELDATRAGVAVERGHTVGIGDALAPGTWVRSPLIVMNPPFSLALPFVLKALAQGIGTTVAAFLRLAFLETQTRAAFHCESPSDVYVLSKRPSFTGDGKTDSAAYAWFVWGPGRGGRWSILDTAGPKAVEPMRVAT